MDLSFIGDYFSPEITVFIVSMLPVSELRGSIPLALGVYGFSPIKAYIISIIGNMLPVCFFLLFLEEISVYLSSKSKFFKNFFNHVFEKTRDKNLKKFEKWGSLALISFVAIPLPVTGAWTGTVAAFVFGISFWRAFFSIFLGVLIAGVIVSALTLGVL